MPRLRWMKLSFDHQPSARRAADAEGEVASESAGWIDWSSTLAVDLSRSLGACLGARPSDLAVAIEELHALATAVVQHPAGLAASSAAARAQVARVRDHASAVVHGLLGGGERPGSPEWLDSASGIREAIDADLADDTFAADGAELVAAAARCSWIDWAKASVEGGMRAAHRWTQPAARWSPSVAMREDRRPRQPSAGFRRPVARLRHAAGVRGRARC